MSAIKTAFGLPTEYTDVEKEKLIEFRKRVSDILDTEEKKDDLFLIRWIRARYGDLNKAEEMLRASMKWRKENNIDTLLEREGHTVPEEMTKMAPIAYCGVTEEGYAAYIVPFGRHDPRAALEKYGLEACEKFNTIIMEQFAQQLRDESKKTGKQVTQIIEICDCEGYSYRQMASKVCREFMIKMQHQMDAHYPEILRYAMMVNTPKVFALVFNMLKPFIPKATLDKVDIIAEPEKWKAVVREKFPIERIPPHWGGTLEGVDEYCSGHEIWIQGPDDLRALMRGLSEADADFHKTNVNAREKFVKEVEVKEKNTILEWKFKTENHDIAFQLTFSPTNNNADGKKVEDIVSSARVDAASCVQEGSHVCEAPGKYTFIFDNTFSVLKGKTLLYQIDVIDPEHQESFEECPEA